MESNHGKKRFLFIGLFFVVAGILFNQWTIGFLRPIPRPIVQIENLFIIWTFQLISIIVGCLFIIYRFRLTEARLILWYKNISAVFVALLTGFVFMNLILYAVSTIRASFAGVDPMTQKYGISARSLYPDLNDAQYQLLMKETWSRPYSYESFTTFKESQYSGTYVNVDEYGFRHIKNQAAWPPLKTNFNIFVFGNSTTFNYSVPDDKTMASYIQEFLRQTNHKNNVSVYNFGRGFYYSSQERALYEKLLIAGYVPNISVFIDGQEEFEPAYAGDNPQFTADIESLFKGGSYAQIFKNLPVVDFWKSFIAAENKKTSQDTSELKKTEVEDSIQRYIVNKKLIEKASLLFGVKSFFVWQPVSAYKYDLGSEPFIPAVQRGIPEGYTAMAEYSSTHTMGDNFLYLADTQLGIKKPLYVDNIHYSEEWSKEIASLIASFLENKIF